jgi:hypothetical protein
VNFELIQSSFTRLKQNKTKITLFCLLLLFFLSSWEDGFMLWEKPCCIIFILLFEKFVAVPTVQLPSENSW